MINLLSAAKYTPPHAFKTTELANSLMHKLSPELINTLNSWASINDIRSWTTIPTFSRARR